MDKLRSKIIRLAYRKPELRSELLPLLTKTASEEFLQSGDFVKVAKKVLTEAFNIITRDQRLQKATIEFSNVHNNSLNIRGELFGSYNQNGLGVTRRSLSVVAYIRGPVKNEKAHGWVVTSIFYDDYMADKQFRIEGDKLGMTDTDFEGLHKKGQYLATEILSRSGFYVLPH